MHDNAQMVPGGVAIASMTNRPELLAPLKAKIAAGTETFTREEMLVMLQLIEATIKDREEMNRKIMQVNQRLKEIGASLRGGAGTVERAMVAFNTRITDDEE